MTRVKRGTIALKRRRNVLKAAKGFRGTRGTKEKLAKENLVKAGLHAFAHRKDKKNDFRRLWTVRINAALQALGFKYSLFIHTLDTKGIKLDRKVLATLAKDRPEAFKRVVEVATK